MNFDSSAYSILVVDNDDNIQSLLKLNLQTEGYRVEVRNSAEEALTDNLESYRLVITEVSLPGEIDGWEFVDRMKESRLTANIPVMFCTTHDSENDIIRGLNAGADDYIVKPFDLDELAARVEAHLRREQRRQGSATVRFFGELAIDYGARTAALNGVQVPFSRREFDIVELLSLNAGQVFDRERIYEAVWGYDGEGNSDTIMEHIRKIRAKLAAHTRHGYIDTVWGCGYRWNG